MRVCGAWYRLDHDGVCLCVLAIDVMIVHALCFLGSLSLSLSLFVCSFSQIIVMSATLDADQFAEYFDKAPVLYVEGRQFPVRVS